MTRVSNVRTLCSLLVFMDICLCAHLLLIREKGSNTAIACAFRKNELNTTWQVRAGHDFVNVTSCTLGQNICLDNMPQQFRGEVKNSSDGFTSTLVINSVRINETEFRCLSKYGIASHKLEVYARPSNPVCDPVELDYTKKNLQFRCNVTNVFPSVSAVLYIRGVNVSREDVLSGHCSNEESGSLDMDGYSTECLWRISAGKLEPIKYKYYVNVFPKLSNSTGVSVPKAVSKDYTLQLSSPIAAIDFTQCPVGPGVMGDTIINGTTASCKCVLQSPGFPVGQVRWYTEKGTRSLSRDDTTNGSSTLMIYPNTISQSFECRAESPLNILHNRGPVYTPVFAIRPGGPVCDPVEFDHTKMDFKFTCRAKDVYASLKAVLYIKGVDSLQEGVISNYCSSGEHRALNLDSHSTECTWRVSAAKLEPIKYKYYVKMFPNLSNSTGISIPYVVSQDYTLQLRGPVAVIDHLHCPFGHNGMRGKIRTGSTASCRCVLESPGFPSGQARWYTLHGNQSLGRDNIADGSSTLEIYNNTQGQSYQCRSESPLNNSLNWGPVYTPVFAAPSSDPETYSLRIEIVAGILAGSIGLTVIIATVLWKWRSRKRQNADTTRVIYNRPNVETQSETESRQSEFAGSTNYLIADNRTCV